MQTNQIKNIVEAVLLAASQPQTLPQLGVLFTDDDGVSHDDLAQALDALRQDCDGRGVELVEVASGYRYQVRQAVHPWVTRMWTERPSRYSRALLETLSLIAYRQPVTRGEIEQIRGVVVSTNIVKTLEEREWIRVVGHRDAPGKPALFGTTRGFLDYFNLKSLDELPPLAEIRDFEDANPQLNFNGNGDGDGTVPAHAAMPAPDGEDTESGAVEAGDTAQAAPENIIQNSHDRDAHNVDQANDTQVRTLPEPTAAEAETPADADDATATQDTQENRA